MVNQTNIEQNDCGINGTYAGRLANISNANNSSRTLYPLLYRLTDQLCKDMVIVFAHRIQSKYLLTKQKMLNADSYRPSPTKMAREWAARHREREKWRLK